MSGSAGSPGRRRKPKFSEYQQSVGSTLGKTGAALLEARARSSKKDLQRSSVFEGGAKFEAESLTRAEFKAFPDARPPPSVKPQTNVLEAKTEDRDFKSVAQSSFIKLGSAKRQPYKPAVTALESSAPFEATSTTRSDFANFAGARPATSAKPQLTQKEEVPETRDFRTENAQLGAVKKYPKPPLVVPQAAVALETGPFEATSTTREDFQYQATRPPRPYKPVQQRELAPEDRDFLTTHSSTVGSPAGKQGAAALEARASSSKQDLQRSSVFDRGVPFQGQSLTRTEFKAFPEARPASSVKPQARAFQADTDGRTAALPASAARTPHVIAALDRDFKSVAQSSFIKLGSAKRQPYKPAVTALESSGPFEATSTTRSDFANFAGARPATSAKPKLTEREEVPDDRTFETDKAAFHKPFKGIHCPPSTKPALSRSALAVDGEDRDFATESRLCFTPKKNEYRNEAAEIRAKVKGGATQIYEDMDEYEED